VLKKIALSTICSGYRQMAARYHVVQQTPNDGEHEVVQPSN
jgi:hypothetical protein